MISRRGLFGVMAGAAVSGVPDVPAAHGTQLPPRWIRCAVFDAELFYSFPGAPLRRRTHPLKARQPLAVQ